MLVNVCVCVTCVSHYDKSHLLLQHQRLGNWFIKGAQGGLDFQLILLDSFGFGQIDKRYLAEERCMHTLKKKEDWMCEYDIIRRCRFSSTFILFSLFHIWYNIASIVFPSLLQLCCVPCCNYEYIFLIDLLKPSKKCDKRPGKRRKTRRGKEIVQRKWSNFYNRNPHICMQKIHEEFRANKVTLKQSEVLQISSWES